MEPILRQFFPRTPAPSRNIHLYSPSDRAAFLDFHLDSPSLHAHIARWSSRALSFSGFVKKYDVKNSAAPASLQNARPGYFRFGRVKKYRMRILGCCDRGLGIEDSYLHKAIEVARPPGSNQRLDERPKPSEPRREYISRWRARSKVSAIQKRVVVTSPRTTL